MSASVSSSFNFSGFSPFFVKSALVLILLLSNAVAVFAYDGDVDLSYTPDAILRGGEGSRVVQQPDGKILVGGRFSNVSGVPQKSIVRLNADGTVDQTFSTPNLIGGGLSINLQPDGKILVAGIDLYTYINGQIRRGIFRLNPGGSMDETFVEGLGIVNPLGGVRSASLQADGKTLVIYGTYPAANIARLNSDGTRDTSFNAVVGEPGLFPGILPLITALPDGKSMLHGRFTTVNGVARSALVRLNSDGSLDNTFNAVFSPDASVLKVVPLADGKILVGGGFASVNGMTARNIARLNPDGSRDTSFSISSISQNSAIGVIKVRADGKIFIGGSFTMINSTPRKYIAKLNTDGSLDTSFNANPNDYVVDILASDNPVIVGGMNTVNNVQRLGIARVDAAGNLDTNFAVALGDKGAVGKVLALPDGKVLITGSFIRVGNTPTGNFVRLNADGTLDSSFNPAVSVDVAGCTLKITTNFKIGIGGRVGVNSSGALKPFAILNNDGSLDTSVSPPDIAGLFGQIAFFQNRKVLVVGRFSVQGGPAIVAAIFNANGSLDTSFRPVFGSESFGDGALIQNDGKFYVSGIFTTVNGIPRNGIVRFNADGSVDQTFNPNLSEYYNAQVTAGNMYLLPDGKLLVHSIFSGSSVSTYRMNRLNADGSLDLSFASPDSWIIFRDFVVQPDGRILLSEQNSDKVIRLKQNGRFDASFNITGSGPRGNDVPRTIDTIAIQSDNRILAAGEFDIYNGVPRFGLARLENSMLAPPTIFDFDADGKSDLSVFRPSDTSWHILKSSNNSYSATPFGLPDDKLVPADYDRDGRTDFAVFRPSDGVWYILNSSTNQVSTRKFGQSGDIPVPADYNNDSVIDIAVYRPSTGVWWLALSDWTVAGNFTVTAIPFGAAGDIPTVGDFDGDGKSDIAVWRPSTGIWYRLNSFNNQFFAYQFGIEGDKPTPADYDGDSKTDISVYRPSNGTWYRLNSADNSLTVVRFGLEEDRPVAADYDGDGKADLAVFRPSSGVWYQLRSTQGSNAQPFGISGDLPIQNAFVP